MARITRSSAAAAAAATANGGANASKVAEPKQLSSPPITPVPGGRKRSRRGMKQDQTGDVDELPHNLDVALPTPRATDNAAEQRTPSRRRTKRETMPKRKKKESVPVADATVKSEESDAVTQLMPKSSPKKANYGLIPGQSPYPDYPRPTPIECREVVRLLEKVHGSIAMPQAIPPPSLDVSGCGEVPSVLDALVRTRLSANTTNKNSSAAFQGLVKRFGVLQDGVGKGSVDWDAVRCAPQKDVYKAIECGGLADRKSKDIQAILQMVYEENQARRAALAVPGADARKHVDGVENQSQREKAAEVEKAEQHIISLDHLHQLDTNAAIEKMLTYPGIGPKTASCVALFCLQRPSFAVDTHVFRLCQYLGWVPRTPKRGQPRVDRNTTYAHCDARIPDELKYPLHKLLIAHGRTCPRCRAVTGQSSAGWEQRCPIEHLVKRHGTKKGGVSIVDRKRAMEAAGMAQGEAETAAKAEIKDEEEREGEDEDEKMNVGADAESELSDVPDDEGGGVKG